MPATATSRPPAVSRFARLRHTLGAAVVAIVACLGGGTAEAGEPVRLLVELPPDVRTVNAGEAMDFQIVGEDSQRQRVSFGRWTVEASATQGTIEVVQAPFRYRYRAPSAVRDVTNVRIRAWLRQIPDVSGEAILQVVPPAPFRRLVIEGPRSTPAGSFVDLIVRGESADGQLREIPETMLTVEVERGAGTIALVRTSRYRFDAPSNARGTSRVVARLVRYPDIATAVDLVISGSQTGPGQGPGPDHPGNRPPWNRPDYDEETDDLVTWPGGNLRVEVWRVKSTLTEDWKRERGVTRAGAEFESSVPIQKIRLATMRRNAKAVDVEQTWSPQPPANPWRRFPQAEPAAPRRGRVTVVDRRDGTKAIHLECELPEPRDTVTFMVTVTYEDGAQTRDTFVLRRADVSYRSPQGR